MLFVEFSQCNLQWLCKHAQNSSGVKLIRIDHPARDPVAIGFAVDNAMTGDAAGVQPILIPKDDGGR